MRFSEDEKFGLLVDYFFEAYLRPILRRIDDGSCAGVEQRVGDERFSANGNERLRPDDEEHAARREMRETLLRGLETLLKMAGDGGAGVGDAEQVGEVLGGGEDFGNSVRIGGV